MNEREDVLAGLQDVVAARLGLAMPPIYRERLESAMAHATSASALPPRAAMRALETLACDAPPWQRVVGCLTVGETSFARQREWFRQIEHTILAPLIAQRSVRGPRCLRIWSAGCSTGEEAYTLAMLVDRLLPVRAGWQVHILGTDVNAAALERARLARYREWALRELDPAQRRGDFAALGNGVYELSPRIRGMVSFAWRNLAQLDAAPGPVEGDFDLVVCRNVLMYFTRAHQQKLGAALVAALAPGGWLAVSPAEANPEWFRPLALVNAPPAIFFHRAADHAVAQVEAHAHAPEPAGPAAAAPVQAALAAGTQDDPLRRAWDLANEGRLGEARALCSRLVERDQLSYEANLLLATVLHEDGETALAAAAAHRAAYLRPDSPMAYFLLGRAQYRLGQLARARRCMVVATRLLQDVADAEIVMAQGEITAAGLRARVTGYLGATGM